MIWWFALCCAYWRGVFTAGSIWVTGIPLTGCMLADASIFSLLLYSWLCPSCGLMFVEDTSSNSLYCSWWTDPCALWVVVVGKVPFPEHSQKLMDHQLSGTAHLWPFCEVGSSLVTTQTGWDNYAETSYLLSVLNWKFYWLDTWTGVKGNL